LRNIIDDEYDEDDEDDEAGRRIGSSLSKLLAAAHCGTAALLHVDFFGERRVCNT